MWDVNFSEACTYHVRNMHWRLAGDICAAVLTFAKTGHGRIEFTRLNDPNRIRLSVEGAAADIHVDRSSRTLAVLRISKAARHS